VEETLAALTELVAGGKLRYLGQSNFTGWQLTDAAHLARETGTAPFVSAPTGLVQEKTWPTSTGSSPRPGRSSPARLPHSARQFISLGLSV
jgi:hypothetical protein